MNEKKICPLVLASGNEDLPSVNCLEERCAWWYVDRCAVLDLAVNTGDIQNVADSIDNAGGGL